MSLLPDWSWRALAPSGAEIELSTAIARRVSWRLDGPADATCTLLADFGLVTERVTDLLAIRDDVLLFRGKVTAASPDVTADRAEVLVVATDYRGLLDEVARVWDQPLSFNTDQGLIAWLLIDQYQQRPGGQRGIVEGLGQTPTRRREMNYPPGEPVGKAITELGRMAGGFEWEISPELALNRWPHGERGVQRGVFDYGGRVAAFSRPTVAPFGNAWVAPGGEGTTPATAESPTVGTDLEGRWERSQAFTTIVRQPTLDERVAWLLEQSLDPAAEWVLALTPGTWSGPSDLWVGDRFTFTAADVGQHVAGSEYQAVEPGLSIDTDVRVTTVTVDVADDENETVLIGAVTYGDT